MAAVPLDPNNLAVGAGYIYVAPIGSTEPTDLATPWDAAWTKVGYTDKGHTFTSETKYDGLVVAEELIPVRYEASGRDEMVEFNMAEVVLANLKLAHNGGTVTTGGAYSKYEPPSIAVAATRAMLGWQSFVGDERLVFRKTIQTGAVAIARDKAPNYAKFAVKFMLEVPAGGLATWAHILASARV